MLYLKAAALSCLILVSPLRAYGLPILVDQDATFRYVNATTATCQYSDGPCSDALPSTPVNWFAPTFDDSGWSTGTAPFSAGFGGDLANVNGPFAPGPTQPIPAGSTAWSVNFDPYLRTEFSLTSPTALTIWVAVDNGILAMYLNGVLATAPVNLEGAAHRWEHVFDIPAAYTVAGNNLLALQLEDHGGATGFVMMMTTDDPATNPVFSTNPPPPPGPTAVPEPATIALLTLGLGAGAAARRKASRVIRQ